MMTRLILMTSVMIFVCACEVVQHNPIQYHSAQSGAIQKYRGILAKDVVKISKCTAVDEMYLNLSDAPASVTKDLPRNVREVWTLKGCKSGVRKRVEISQITDRSSSYTIRMY